jgi:hypothetical protein
MLLTYLKHTYDIDYVAKSDTETLLFLDKMTEFMDEICHELHTIEIFWPVRSSTSGGSYLN